MNDLDNYRNQALRIISGLEERLGIQALEDARDLVECNEAPIGLSIAAGLIAERNLTVPMWIVEDIKRLLQEWPEELAELPEHFEAHGSVLLRGDVHPKGRTPDRGFRMLRLFTLDLIQNEDVDVELDDILGSLCLPELSWTAEDIFVNVSPGSGLEIRELERVSGTPGLPNPVLDHATFTRLVAATVQFIEGEFIGFQEADVGQLDKAVIVIDVVDGAWWTVILDLDRVGVQDRFTAIFGNGTSAAAMSRRPHDT